jgi:hypothetical protein
MSIERCEQHGHWDSDFVENCPLCASSESIADLIPQWYEGGTCQQMLDEAFAQIRLLESAPPERSSKT